MGRFRALVIVALLAAGLVWSTGTAGANVGTVTSFPVATQGNEPTGIATGPDGNLWFTESNGNAIGRITPGGQLTVFPLPSAFAGEPGAIAAGPDGALWFTQFGRGPRAFGAIGRITTGGVLSEFTAGVDAPVGITSGPDGALWFTDPGADSIGRITTAGVVTEYALGSPSFSPEQIVEGPDGNLWFTQTANGDIGRMTPSGGLSEFFAHFANNAGPEGITSGPDDDLWFADPNDNTIGAMTTSGRVAKLFTITQPPGTPPATLLTLTTTTEGPPRTVQRTTTTTTTIPQPSPISAGFITAGPDGNLWLAAYNGLIDSGYILRLTPTGSQTLFPTTQQPARLTVGPDCAIWFTSITEVNRIDTGVRSLPPSTGTPPGCHPATTAGR